MVKVWPFPLDCDVAVNTGGRPSTCDIIIKISLIEPQRIMTLYKFRIIIIIIIIIIIV